MPVLRYRMPVRVLCVDDEPAIRLTLPEVLGVHGFEVTSTATVSEALYEITSHDFDVLISDLNVGFPGDGFTVVSAMRRTHPDCVNFILTGYPEFESALQTIRNQVDDYLLKPADIPQMVTIIQQRLRDRSRGARRPAPMKRVARVLRDRSFDIVQRTLTAMKENVELSALPLSDEERIRHIPAVLSELAGLLESGADPAREDLIKIVGWRGQERMKQGYSIPMLATSICLLEQTIYDVIHESLFALDLSFLLRDLKRLSESLAVQLGETLRAYLRAEERAP